MDKKFYVLFTMFKTKILIKIARMGDPKFL
jgi:hypothetical protein